MTPQRIQLSRRKGWRMPPNTVKVDRSTKWGNPYTIKGCRAAGYIGTDEQIARMCVDEYRRWLRGWNLDELKSSLKGKNIACWCAPGAPCHGDVLLELANEHQDR